jgi:hypothetical protein
VAGNSGHQHEEVVASRVLGPSIFSNRPSIWSSPNDFYHQLLYSSDQRYLIVQDLREIKVLDAGTLEVLRTIPVPATAAPLIPVSVLGAGKSDIFACAYGSENQPEKYRFRAVPVQIEVVDVSSGKILGAWAAEDVPQALSPNGDLIAVSSWQKPHSGVVPLAVYDRDGRKVADLNDGFAFRKVPDPSKPLGRALGRFVSEQEVVVIPDQHLDETGHESGDAIKLLSVTGNPAQQSVAPHHFSPTGPLEVSDDGNTILVYSSYISPRIMAQPHVRVPRAEDKLFILRPDPQMAVDSALTMETGEPRLSSDGSVIAIRDFNNSGGFTILMRSRHP